MNTTPETAIELLSNDPKLAPHFSQRPSAALIPFMKSQEALYLLVSLVIKGRFDDFEKIAFVCLESLRALLPSNRLYDVSGLEIVPYVEYDGQIKKLFRLSIRKEAFSASNHLTKEDLLHDTPRDGITCGWYVTKPAVPPK